MSERMERPAQARRSTGEAEPPHAKVAESERLRAEVERLRDQIRHHEYLYYVLDQPEIGDAQFDALLRRLQEIEEAHPELRSPDSPTQRVGGAVQAGFTPVTHPAPLLSLQDVFSPEELVSWGRRVEESLATTVDYVLEAKIDGL